MAVVYDKKIAILGGGAQGKAFAADSILGGAKNVIMCDLEPFASATLNAVERGITIRSKFGFQLNKYGFLREGTAKGIKTTTSVAEAVKGAELVLVVTPAAGHVPFFEKLIPVLEDGMVVHVFPDNYGSLILRRMMKEKGCEKKIVVGGWSSSPYSARVEIFGKQIMNFVTVSYRAANLRGCAFPSTDTAILFESAKYIPPMDSVIYGDGPQEGDTVVDVGFSNVNPILHCPATLLNIGAIENWHNYGNRKGTYSIYTDGFSPSISEVQYAIYLESVEIVEKLGINVARFKKERFFHRTNILADEFWGEEFVVEWDEFERRGYGTGPHDVNTRYLTEDIPVGTRMYHEFGKITNTKTPIVDTMIHLAGIMLHKNYFEEGYTLDYLGLGGKSEEAIVQFLRTGE